MHHLKNADLLERLWKQACPVNVDMPTTTTQHLRQITIRAEKAARDARDAADNERRNAEAEKAKADALRKETNEIRGLSDRRIEIVCR